MPTPTPPTGRPGGSLWLSILGRFLTVIALALIGLVTGLAFGADRAVQEVAALPPMPARPTMGMESAGVVPFVIWGIDLALGAIGGAVLGLVIGVMWAIFWPRPRA